MIEYITHALAALDAGSTTIKFLYEVDRQYDEAELKMKVADLAGAISKSQLALAKANNELESKETEIDRLKQTFKMIDEDTVEVKHFRYRTNEKGEAEGWPFCNLCLAKEAMAIQLVRDPKMSGGAYNSYCPNCGSKYGLDVRCMHP